MDKLLPKPSKVRKVKHFAAMPYDQLPGFFTMLRKRETVSARALAFTILATVRTTETRLARIEEIDFIKAVWTIPAERTKSGRDHRVPLTKEALAVLKEVNKDTGLIFQNADGEALSDAAMRKYLHEDMKHPTLTVHGFRSTFRDQQSNAPRLRARLPKRPWATSSATKRKPHTVAAIHALPRRNKR